MEDGREYTDLGLELTHQAEEAMRDGNGGFMRNIVGQLRREHTDRQKVIDDWTTGLIKSAIRNIKHRNFYLAYESMIAIEKRLLLK